MQKDKVILHNKNPSFVHNEHSFHGSFSVAVEDHESQPRRSADAIAVELAPKTRSELRGILLALEEERRDVEARRRRIAEFQEKLSEQRSSVAEERKTVLEAVTKLGLAEKKFVAKIKDFEEVANVSTVRLCLFSFSRSLLLRLREPLIAHS